MLHFVKSKSGTKEEINGRSVLNLDIVSLIRMHNYGDSFCIIFINTNDNILEEWIYGSEEDRDAEYKRLVEIATAGTTPSICLPEKPMIHLFDKPDNTIKWTRCSDALPPEPMEEELEYLLCWDDEYIEIGRYCGKGTFQHTDASFDYESESKVTHWAPAPRLPAMVKAPKTNKDTVSNG